MVIAGVVIASGVVIAGVVIAAGGGKSRNSNSSALTEQKTMTMDKDYHSNSYSKNTEDMDQ